MKSSPRHFCILLTVIVCFPLLASSKNQPSRVIIWPPTGTPLVRFTFGKISDLASSHNLHTYTIDTVAENLWGKPINNAVFNLYLFDASKARIGEGWISLNNVGIGQTVKFVTTISASGNPVSLDVDPRSLPDGYGPPKSPRQISMTVNSVPQGANLKLDGQDAGTTPASIQVGEGKHILEFSKEGFNSGNFPLEISKNDASGGSVSYELGTSAHDTIELRDGSVLSGDLESVSATDVVIRVGGAIQHLDRNQVKRILMIERDAPGQ